MKIIVTGGCGFVGFNLANSLAQKGHEVLVVDNLVRRGSETNVFKIRNTGIQFIHADIRNNEDLQALPEGFEWLVECSAQPSVVSGYTNPLYDLRTNLIGAINCLELCRHRNMAMIFLSSSRIYPADRLNAIPFVQCETRWDWTPAMNGQTLPEGFDPLKGINAHFSIDGATKTIYGASKAAADIVCQEYGDAFGIPVIVNRCGVIAGEGQFGVVGQGWVTYWVISCLMGRPITYLGYKGKQVRDILFIRDLCDLIELQLTKGSCLGGKVWNVGGGRTNSLSLLEATDLVQRLTGKKMTVSHSNVIRKGDIRIYITDNNEVSRDLGWAPSQSIYDGLDKIVAWVSNNRSLLSSAGL